MRGGDGIRLCQGRKSALEEQINELQKKLKTPLYKDIDKRYRLKVCLSVCILCAASECSNCVCTEHRIRDYHGGGE